MKVSDIMTKDVVACKPSDPIESVVKLMSEKDISGVPVLDGDKLVGIVTEADILRILAVPPKSDTLWLPSPLEIIFEIPFKELVQLRRLQKDYKDIGLNAVESIMKKDVISTTPDADIEDAASLMVKHKINRLAVIQKGRLVGIITRDDIIHGLGGRKKTQG
jgi:CBS domain-containing protein